MFSRIIGPEEIAVAELREKLKNHDWYYDWSDDPNAWQRGNKQSQEITALVKKLGMIGRIEYNKLAPNKFKE